MQTHHRTDRSAHNSDYSALFFWITPLVLALTAPPVKAQEASFVYRLGKDTIAVEQFTRGANRMTGETVSRQGAAVTRMQYDVTLGSDGRATRVTFRVRNAAGAVLPNQPSEVRLTFVGDSVKREAVFADSVNSRMLPAARATPIASPAYGLYEVAFAQLRKTNAPTATFASIGTGAGTGSLTLNAGGGDTIRTSNPGGTIVFLVDRQGRLQQLDATNTTAKWVATRATTLHDMNALASRFTPAGVLSPRGLAHGSFMQSVVFIDYGRPSVRGRTVWGGELIPFDTIWRTGANEATHLATSRELTFGDVVVPPGLYTLWIFNARSGPQLAINKQVGQWGAGPNVYDASKDLARVPLAMSATPEPVEDFTINIRSAAPNRGSIDFLWGAQMASAAFTVR